MAENLHNESILFTLLLGIIVIVIMFKIIIFNFDDARKMKKSLVTMATFAFVGLLYIVIVYTSLASKLITFSKYAFSISILLLAVFYLVQYSKSLYSYIELLYSYITK